MRNRPTTSPRPYNRVPHIEELGEIATLLLNTPFLGLEEERGLAERAKQGDQEAFDKLVNSHMRLVVAMARKFNKSGLPFGDLVQEGAIGLIEGVKRFEVEKGFRLSTYAGWWIRSYIQSFAMANRSLVKLGTTTEQKRMFSSLAKARARLETEGVPAGEVNARLAAEFGVSIGQVLSFEGRLAGEASLNAKAADDGDMEMQDFLVDPAPSQEEVLAEGDEGARRRALLAEALDLLNDREREILTARHIHNDTKTLEDLAQIYGVTRERIRQIEVKALDKVTRQVRRTARLTGLLRGPLPIAAAPDA